MYSHKKNIFIHLIFIQNTIVQGTCFDWWIKEVFIAYVFVGYIAIGCFFVEDKIGSMTYNNFHPQTNFLEGVNDHF